MALTDYSSTLVEMVKENIDENSGNDGVISVAGIKLIISDILEVCAPVELEMMIDEYVENAITEFENQTGMERNKTLYVGENYSRDAESWITKYLNDGKSVDDLIEDAGEQEPNQWSDDLTEVHCGRWWELYECLPPENIGSCKINGGRFFKYQRPELYDVETATYGIDYNDEYYFLHAKPRLTAEQVAAIFITEHSYYSEKNLVIEENND